MTAVQKSTAAPAAVSRKRADIQGMRALAVLLVVANHLFSRPTGGFIGVDVFFVLSGYLITGLLVREAEQTSTVSIREFYARRVRRILPVAALVLLTTNLVANRVFSSLRATQTHTDSLWALFFSANVHFSALGTDYFQADRPPSAVQHFWSLSVEEQFYIAWPTLLIVTFLLSRRLRVSSRRLVFGLALISSGASLAWCLHLTSVSQTTAYFSTTARAWELGLGALLAVSQRQISRLPSAVRAALSWIGFAGIAVAAFTFTSSTVFPGYAALLPVLATGLVLAADDPRGGIGQIGLLNNRAAQYVGNVSYSLYLWHFPCIVLATGYFATKGLTYYLAAGFLPVALSIASFHFVEDPIRRSRWLSRKPAHYRRRTVAGWKRDNEKTLNALLAGFAVVVIGGSAAVLSVPKLADASGPYALAGRTAQAQTSTFGERGGTLIPSVGSATHALQEGIDAALKTSAWPGSLPDLSSIADGPQAPEDAHACAEPVAITHPCAWGDPSAPHTAMLVGDSIAMTYTTPLRKIFAGLPGWRFTSYALIACMFTASDLPSADKEINRICPDHKMQTINAINTIKPDLLIISNNYIDAETISGKSFESTNKIVRSFSTNVRKIIFLAPPLRHEYSPL